MSEENKNKNKDKGRQRNVIKYDTEPERGRRDVEFAEDSEFVNINGRKNKRKRK
ncbi:hypothetical protein [Oceanobacillus senegalensis]|uniref:hypothetical protein n=1 Tax=Oceanobacillus senegalensis TaxID=1936063 RepID=UPI0015C41F91|nr:hypothetical protein [Oceanobacillus senegalensis]